MRGWDESLRTKVSVAGKRDFQGRDKEAENSFGGSGRRCRDKISLSQPANSGLFAENREISVCRSPVADASDDEMPSPRSFVVDASRCEPANDQSGLRWGCRCIVITGRERPLAKTRRRPAQ